MIGFILAAALHASQAERYFCAPYSHVTLAQCDKVLRHWACHQALTRRWPSDDDVAKRNMARIRREHPCLDRASDTHPKGGNSTQIEVPFMGSAVAKRCAQTPVSIPIARGP